MGITLIKSSMQVNSIAIKQLTYDYQDRLFERLDLIIESGSLVQITGKNGAGKSTLLKILAGILPIEPHSMFINDCNDRQVFALYQQRIRYIGHQPGCKAELTVDENLQYDSVIYNQMLPMNLVDHLTHWQLNHYQHNLVQYLSYGQKRKVSMLKLTCFPGQIWLLDEPYVGLDKAACEFLTKIINSHVQNQGIVILSTHQEIANFGLVAEKIINL